MYVVAKQVRGLPGLPATEKGARDALQRLSDNHPEFVRRRAGTKAKEYHIDCLPEGLRELARQHVLNQLIGEDKDKTQPVVERKSELTKVSTELEIMRKCPALLERKLGSLTDKQKQIADARMTLVLEVRRLMDVGGMSRKAAVELVASRSKDGTLPEVVQRAADTANARKGGSRRGVGARSLQTWFSEWQVSEGSGERLAVMAPGHGKAKPVEAYPWMADFLRKYRNPNRPSVAAAYEALQEDWLDMYGDNQLMMAQLPTLDNVRYALKKIPKAERQRGRYTGAEYKSLLPFIRRDWSVMPVNGVWVGDGHGMKMEVINPATGKPFRPEITLVIEGLTRVVVGWSLAQSESQVAVGDAIRHAVSQYGVPLIYYSDNGGGEKNSVFDADITGIFSRIGIDHPTGIPGNPQARGIIERLNREIPARAAKTFGSYVGKSGDRETQRKYRKAIDSALNAMEKGKELNAEQAGAMRKVPTWEQLTLEIEKQIQRHNNRPHSTLPKRENGEHWSPAAYRRFLIERDSVEIDFLTRAELTELFRPERVCVARRGEVQLHNNIYFSTELGVVEGEEVRVCYDIHDPQTVIIRRMDGSWICEAVWNGNKVDAFAKAVIEQAEEKSNKRKVERLEQRVARVKEERKPSIELQPETDFAKFMPAEDSGKKKIHIFESEYEHEQNLKKHG